MTLRSPTKQVPGGGFLAGASAISAFSFLGVVAGFVVNALIAAKYGVGPEVDAFFVAYTIPFLLQGLARASCTTVLIPAFSRHAATSADGEMRRFFSLSLSAAFVLGGVLALIGIAGSPVLAGLLAPGASIEVREISGELTPVLFGVVSVTWAVSVIRAFLYSHELFAIPSAVDGIQRAVAAAVLLAIGRYVGIAAIAYGYVLGTITQLVVEVAVLIRRWGPKYYYFNLRFSRSDVQTAKQMLLSLSNALLGQGTVTVDRIVASFLPEGSIAILGYARQLLEIVAQVLLGSLPLAIMPSLSASLARRAQHEVRDKLASLLSFMSGISIPLGTYLILLSPSLVYFLFERGSFSENATRATASVLSVYGLGIFIVGYFRVAEFYLYAKMKANQVLLLFCLFAISTLCFDIVLARFLGIRGIALAYSVALAAPLIIGFALIRESLPAATWRSLFVLNAKMLGACASAFVASSIAATVLRFTSSLSGASQHFLITSVVTIVYLVALIVVLRVLRVEEFDKILAVAGRRILQARRV